MNRFAKVCLSLTALSLAAIIGGEIATGRQSPQHLEPVAAPAAESVGTAAEPPTSKNANAAPIPIAAQVLPTHHFVMEEEGEYGYTQGISDDDEKAGVASKSLLMFRYVGHKNGVYTVEHHENDCFARYTMKDDAQFIKTTVICSGQVVNTDVHPNANGSVGNAVFEDAQSGALTQYGKRKAG